MHVGIRAGLKSIIDADPEEAHNTETTPNRAGVATRPIRIVARPMCTALTVLMPYVPLF